jgi:hypothetical protein
VNVILKVTVISNISVNVFCFAGVYFQFNGESVLIPDFQCTEVPQSTIRETGICSSGHKRLQIGYEMSEKFIRLIDICFNDMNYSTSYVNYTLIEGIDRRQNIQQSRQTYEAGYYTNLPHSPETYFTCSYQQRTIGTAIDSSPFDRYIKCSDNINYLTRAHLAAAFDFVYGAQQRSTMYYVNVVPMWHSIKNGNWMKLEEEIRQYASNTSREASHLIVYSGTLGVTNLANRDIYLGRDSKDSVVLPVPKWVWKLVYEPTTKEGIVFLVVNNPYRRYFACNCVCAQTKWTLAWNRQDMNKGYVYCCTVPNFRRVFSGLPNFDVTGLLTKNRPYTPQLVDVAAQ